MTTTTHRTPISQAAAEAEPESERLFGNDDVLPVAYPAITLRTTVIDPDGFTWQVTFADTSLAAAAAVLRKRGCVPAGGAPPALPPSAPHTTTHGGAPVCPTHQKPMKPMAHADKAGRTHWCTQKEGTGFCGERA